MAVVVCKFCGTFVRNISPPRSNLMIKGVCRKHAKLLQVETRLTTNYINSFSDILETCLVSYVRSRT